jgi:hypothetical protein
VTSRVGRVHVWGRGPIREVGDLSGSPSGVGRVAEQRDVIPPITRIFSITVKVTGLVAETRSNVA